MHSQFSVKSGNSSSALAAGDNTFMWPECPTHTIHNTTFKTDYERVKAKMQKINECTLCGNKVTKLDKLNSAGPQWSLC